MLPIVTPEEMAAIEVASRLPSEILIERAGTAVAWAALRMLGGAYGRTVNVVCGKGNNGADGKVAARHLAVKGVRVRIFEAAACPSALPPADLVIDAAYGTGFRGTWKPPDVGGAPVLAVDVPSGVDALTGDITGDVLAAAHTVTFAALKPGLLMPPGSALAGVLELADIGLDIGWARANLVQGADIADWWPERDEYAHKWQSAVRVVAGSSTMTGAPRLVAHAAMRTGAGMVHLSVPGMTLVDAPIEIVQRSLPSAGWADAALASLERFHAVVVGPGLGRSDETAANVRKMVLEAPLPMVIDGDGLFALGWSSEGATALLRRRSVPTVLTPHDGEYALLSGSQPGVDRMVAARRLAADSGCTVLLKGAATIIADPDGDALVVTAGDARLATAGTGDVLSGIIGALLAGGMQPLHAAAAGAWVHGQAGRRGQRHGLVASDLPDLIPAVLEELLVSRWAWAEVDLGALRHNVEVMCAVAAPAQVWASVKADGYGHGAVRVAGAAMAGGATGLCVALVQEGIILRDAGFECPILVLSEQPPSELPAAVRRGLDLTVYSTAQLEAIAAAGGRDHPVHLKIDTGMRRVGAAADDALSVAEAIIESSAVRLAGICTHLAVADEPTDPFTAAQIQVFEEVRSALAVRGYRAPLVHAANSAATLALPTTRFGMVRVGIAMYGISPGPAIDHLSTSLRPALSLHARVSHVKRVRLGDRISYGLKHRFDRDTTVATLPLGYADGVPRRLFAVRGAVLIGGRRRPIVGVVTMDQLMVDCGDDPVAVADEAVLIGHQEGESITANEWADRLGTISYEIVCGISARVERRYSTT